MEPASLGTLDAAATYSYFYRVAFYVLFLYYGAGSLKHSYRGLSKILAKFCQSI
jgi:hypothetical protein